MKKTALMILLTQLLVTNAQAAISCTNSENKVAYYIGFDPSADDVPTIEGFAPGGEGDATTLLTNFVTQDYTNKTSTTHSVDVDVATQAITSSSAIGASEILSSTDLANGRLDFSFCAPGTLPPNGLLSHTVYTTSSGAFVGVQSNVASLENGVAQGVINASSSDNIGRTFNQPDGEGIKGDDRIVAMVEEGAGTSLDPVATKSLAQRIFTFALNFSTEQTNKNNAQLNKPTNAFVEGNEVFVEGGSAQVYATNAVTGIKNNNGSNIASSNNRVTGLENKVGNAYVLETLQGNKPFYVVEARGDLSGSSSYTCDEGSNVTISSSFSKNSPLEGIINVYNGNTLLSTATDGSLDYTLPCDDVSLTLEGYRTSTRGVDLKPSTKNVTVSKNVVQQTVLIGLDTDLDGNIDVPDADRDGNLDGIINIDCNAPVNYKFDLIAEPVGQHTYFGGSMPQGMSLNQSTGRITYDAPCSDAGQTFSAGFNADGGPTLHTQFKVF